MFLGMEDLKTKQKLETQWQIISVLQSSGCPLSLI